MKSSKSSDENINVKSNWDLNLTPLIPKNIESKFTYSESSYNRVHDIVSENENTDDDIDIDDLFSEVSSAI